MKIHKMLAGRLSYNYRKKRSRKSVKYIVIHYTGNSGDTAKSNAKFFANKNKREAGAHFFVDSNEIWRSVPMNRTAWSVGGKYTVDGKAGRYYGKCTNTNSVSIELTNAINGYSPGQVKNVKWLIKYIKKKCPNVTHIIRHYDVNGKQCPKCLINENEWKQFLREVL